MTTEPKTFEANKDGTISVKDEVGNLVRYTKEVDLLAVKGSKEEAEGKLTTIEAGHKTAIEAVNTLLITANDKLNQAEVSKKELEEQVKEHTGSKEELDSTKQKLTDAETKTTEQSGKVLELKKQLICTTFGVAPATVENKTPEQLDAYEEALKAVAAGKGVGSYAIPGASGGEPLGLMHGMAGAAKAYADKGYDKKG